MLSTKVGRKLKVSSGGSSLIQDTWNSEVTIPSGSNIPSAFVCYMDPGVTHQSFLISTMLDTHGDLNNRKFTIQTVQNIF
jgi:hypothetical protein